MQHANVFASDILTGGQREYDRCVRFLDRCTFHPADFQIGGILRNGVQRNAQFPLLRLLTGVECLADKSFQFIFGRGCSEALWKRSDWRQYPMRPCSAARAVRLPCRCYR